MKILLVLIAIMIIGISYADATILENKIISGASGTTSINIQFIDDIFIRSEPTPVIKSGEFTAQTKNFDLKNAEIRYLTSNSFVIKEDNLVLYIRSSNSNYKVNSYIAENGVFQKATLEAKLYDKPILKEPVKESVIITEKPAPDFHYLIKQYERVYNNQEYKFFVKTFDKSIYSGNNFENFQGKISGAKVYAIIHDPNGEIKADFEGTVTNGLYEGSVFVPENLWQRGWYTVDLAIEQDGIFKYDKLTFYVYGSPVPKGSTANSTAFED